MQYQYAHFKLTVWTQEKILQSIHTHKRMNIIIIFLHRNKESTTTMQLKLLLLCAVVMLPSVDGIPHNMVKRSDDPTPLESVVMQLSSDVSNLKAQVSALQTKLGTSICPASLCFHSLFALLFGDCCSFAMTFVVMSEQNCTHLCVGVQKNATNDIKKQNQKKEKRTAIKRIVQSSFLNQSTSNKTSQPFQFSYKNGSVY